MCILTQKQKRPAEGRFCFVMGNSEDPLFYYFHSVITSATRIFYHRETIDARGYVWGLRGDRYLHNYG